LLFTAAESAYTDTDTERSFERQIIVCPSLQLNELILILILGAVFKRQILVCSSLQLCQLILIMILSAVIERQRLVCTSLQLSQLILILTLSAVIFDRILFSLHCS